MRVTFRLVAVLLLIILGLLAFDSYLIVQRDVRQNDRDMRRDAVHLARILAEAVAATEFDGNESRARDLIGELSAGDESLVVRWFELGRTGSGDSFPELSPADSAALGRGESVSFKAATNGGRFRYTLVPVPGLTSPVTALMVGESLYEQAQQTRRTIYRSLVLGGLVTATGAILMLVFGIRMVGRPLKQLVAKTERIGAGDLSGDLVLRGRDELSDLARAMNRMCGQLARARAEVEQKNQARLEALDQLRHTERLTMLGQLSSGLAHELGTPLNVVAGRAKMIARREIDQAEVVDSAEIIHVQVERMTELVRRFLDYARRGASRRAPEDLRAVATRSLAMLRPAASKAGVEIDLEAPDDLPLVTVDRVQVEQVLVNLVMNGIQAMLDGGELRVTLTAEPGGHVALRVTDHGIGIPADQLDQVCEPFFTTKKTGQGTGLGLSIVKGIVEDNHGTLAIESTAGRGTTITVRFECEDES